MASSEFRLFFPQGNHLILQAIKIGVSPVSIVSFRPDILIFSVHCKGNDEGIYDLNGESGMRVHHAISDKQLAANQANAWKSTEGEGMGSMDSAGTQKVAKKATNEATTLFKINDLTYKTNLNEANREASKSFRLHRHLERSQRRSQ